jgi:hypothetical protein
MYIIIHYALKLYIQIMMFYIMNIKNQEMIKATDSVRGDIRRF